MKIYIFFLKIGLLFFFGCNELKNSRQNQLIARVENNYLYMSDLDNIDFKYTSISDSTIKIQNYINAWAKNLLLYDRSLLNTKESKIKELDRLVDQYKLDLFNNSYKTSIVKAKIDTSITQSQMSEFYKTNSAIFLLKEPLYRYRFIQFPKNNNDRKEITNRFKRYSDIDKIFLDSLSFQFSYSFRNDSLWYNKKAILKNASFLTSDDLLKLKNSKIFEVEDTIQLYLLKIEDYLSKNQKAPLSYVEKTIRNIVFNQRKLDFLKKFDQEIINDAIQNKKFEIYQ
jgi:hypothetical protein